MDPCQIAWGVAMFLFLAAAVLARAVRILSDYEGAVFLIWPGGKYRVAKEYLGKVEPVSQIPVSTIETTSQEASKKRDDRERWRILKKIRKMIEQSDERTRDRLAELQAAILTNHGATGELNGIFQTAEKIFRSKREPQPEKKRRNKAHGEPQLGIQDYVASILYTKPTIQEETFGRIFELLPPEIEFRTAVQSILVEYLTPGTKVFENQRILVRRGWVDKFARAAHVAPRAYRRAIDWLVYEGVLRRERLKGRTAEGEWLDLNLDPKAAPSITGREIISICNQLIRHIKGAGGRIKENLLPPP